MGILQDIEHAPAAVANAVRTVAGDAGKSVWPNGGAGSPQAIQSFSVPDQPNGLPGNGPGVKLQVINQPANFQQKVKQEGNEGIDAEGNPVTYAQDIAALPKAPIGSPPPELMKLAQAAPVNMHGPSYALGLKAGHEAAMAVNNPDTAAIVDPVNFGLAGSMDLRNQPQVE